MSECGGIRGLTLRFPRAIADAWIRDGVAVVRGVVPRGIVTEACDATASSVDAGVRAALGRWGALDALAHHDSVRDLVRALGFVDALIVRSILFDKTAQRNWPVAPHQDVAIAVAARVESPGYGPWSEKEGVVHTQPPREVLESMVTLRVHLDPCPATNGALRVLAHSHRGGVLSETAIRDRAEREAWVTCEADAGDVVVMSPLAVHASSRAEHPSRRRVLHLELASEPLPKPLEWRWATRL